MATQHDKTPEATYTDCVLVSAGASETERKPAPPAPTSQEVAEQASSPQTAAGAAAPLSTPALESAPRGEDGPLVSEADPTSNAG